MRSNFLSVLAAALLAAFVMSDSPLFAQKAIPPGTIYFRHDGSLWQMDSAGTPASRVRLPTVTDSGHPSYARHGGQRWFLYGKQSGPLPPRQFPNGRSVPDVYAASDTGVDVFVFAEADIEIISGPAWVSDDASVTFLGERWALDSAGQPTEVVEAGLYELYVDCSSGAPVAGPLVFLADLSGIMGSGAQGFPATTNSSMSHSWNNDGTQCAIGISWSDTNRSIWLFDLTAISDPYDVPASAFQLFASGNVAGPSWSPDGKRLAFYSQGETVVHNLATGKKKSLGRTATASWGGLVWSPTGSYVVVYHWDNWLPGYDALYRFTADLGGKTELTAGLSEPLPSFNVFIPLGWRN
jgi:hypothetical protein